MDLPLSWLFCSALASMQKNTKSGRERIKFSRLVSLITLPPLFSASNVVRKLCSSSFWGRAVQVDSLPDQVAWAATPEDFCYSHSSSNSLALASCPPSGQEEEEIFVNSFFCSCWEFPVLHLYQFSFWE